MQKIGEGGQSIIYKLNDEWIFKHYKLDKKYPIDFKTIEIMCNEINALKRIILPIKIDYDILKKQIVGTYSRYVQNKEINLGNVLCSTLHQWYMELYSDVKILSSKKIRMNDLVTWNFIFNENGPFMIDVDSFIYCPEKANETLEMENIKDLNYTFLYGFIWKVGQFATKKSINEILEEIFNFKRTLYDYLKLKNPYEYDETIIGRTIKK